MTLNPPSLELGDVVVAEPVYLDMVVAEPVDLDMVVTQPGALDVVVAQPTARANGHTATFPPELVRPRIVSSCPSVGHVLDPFCGVGTVVAEAFRSGRNATGFEKNSEYADYATTSLCEEFGSSPGAQLIVDIPVATPTIGVEDE